MEVLIKNISRSEIHSKITEIISLIEENQIDAWEFDLEKTTEAVMLENHQAEEDKPEEVYNGWFEKLQQLQDSVAESKTVELFPRRCSVTGEGTKEAFYFESKGMYIASEENAEEYANSQGYDDLEASYEAGNHYWTEWEDEEITEAGEGFDSDGNKYELIGEEWILTENFEPKTE